MNIPCRGQLKQCNLWNYYVNYRKNVFRWFRLFDIMMSFLACCEKFAGGKKLLHVKQPLHPWDLKRVVWNVVNLSFQLEHKANVLRAKLSKDAVTNFVHLQDEFRVQFCLAKIFRNKLLRMKICSVLSVLPFQISSLPRVSPEQKFI